MRSDYRCTQLCMVSVTAPPQNKRCCSMSAIHGGNLLWSASTSGVDKCSAFHASRRHVDTAFGSSAKGAGQQLPIPLRPWRDLLVSSMSRIVFRSSHCCNFRRSLVVRLCLSSSGCGFSGSSSIAPLLLTCLHCCSFSSEREGKCDTAFCGKWLMHTAPFR